MNSLLVKNVNNDSLHNILTEANALGILVIELETVPGKQEYALVTFCDMPCIYIAKYLDAISKYDVILRYINALQDAS